MLGNTCSRAGFGWFIYPRGMETGQGTRHLLPFFFSLGMRDKRLKWTKMFDFKGYIWCRFNNVYKKKSNRTHKVSNVFQGVRHEARGDAVFYFIPKAGLTSSYSDLVNIHL